MIRAFGERVIPEIYAHLMISQYVADILHHWWSEAYLEQVLRSGNGILALAEDETSKELLACAEVEINGNQAILWKLYVRSDQRRRGIGSQLLEWLKESLSPSVEVLLTSYLSLNKTAAQFYLKQRFRFDHLEEDQTGGNYSYTWLRLPLRASQMVEPATLQLSSQHHRSLATDLGSIPLAIVTVSDTRTLQTDANGRYLIEQIIAMGHFATAHRIVKDEPDQIEAVLEDLCSTPARIILFNGGTGISQRDTTYDVIQLRLEKILPGFGELFRMLSYEQVGAAAMFSRATAGTYRGKVIISLPGSPAAVQLAWEKLIAPEIQHLAWEIAR